MTLGVRTMGLILVALILPACATGGGATLTPTVAPAIPQTVTATPGQQRVTIRWSSPTSGATYTIKRSLTSGGPYFPVSGGQSPTSTSYVDSGLTNGTPYYYVVSASNQFGTSFDSPEAQATPGFRPLSVFSGPASHSLAILPDRTLWAWGNNALSELGSGHLSGQSGSPIEVTGLVDVTAAAAGGGFSLALKNDSSVWVWGDNTFGIFGNGTADSSRATTPQLVPGLSGVVALAAGGSHAVALKNDGTVWTWGANNVGQLGNGAIGAPDPTPKPIPGLAGVKAIASGAQHNLAVRDDGSVWAWGTNNDGQLGRGASGLPVPDPAQIPNLTSFTTVAAGGSHSLALRSDGTVWAWGNNESGQVGNGVASATDVVVPVQVLNLTEVGGIAAGFAHSYAVKDNGTLWAWGDCTAGQLGTGASSGNSPVPVPVQNAGQVVAVAAGWNHGLCLDQNGTLRGWGENLYGAVGDGTSGTHDLPVPVPNLTDVVAVSASDVSTMVLRGDGSVWGWGLNNRGQLGIGSPSLSTIYSPSQVTAISGVKAIACGSVHTLAVKTSGGTVWAWGNNQFSQLGQGAPSADVPSPVQVSGLSNITAVAAGRSSSFALKDDGTVWQWGDYDWLYPAVPIPNATQVSGLSGITAIASGWNHVLALKNDGTVWAWGHNAYGQLGTLPPAATTYPTPAPVLGLSAAIAISAGDYSSFAVRSDGSVWAWGAVSLNGAPAATGIAPGPVVGVSNATAVSAGDHFTLALLNDGSVRAWGGNLQGQLGIGDETDEWTPTAVPTLAGVLKLSAGLKHGTAILADHTMDAWGENGTGQVGVPYSQIVTLPSVIVP